MILLNQYITHPTVTISGNLYQIDFGRELGGNPDYEMPVPWNNFTDDLGILGGTLSNLIDTDSNVSSLAIETIQAWNSGYQANTTAVDELYPFPATRDALGTVNGSAAEFQLQNCDPTKLYTFTFFPSRGFTGQFTDFTIGGTTVRVDHRDGDIPDSNTGNLTQIGTIVDVIPDVSNNINILVEGIDENLNPSIGILNVMEILEKNIPLLPNLYLENDAADFNNENNSVGNNWSGDGDVTIVSESIDPQIGSYHLTIESTTAGGATSNRAEFEFVAEVGEQYEISIWAKEAVGSDGRLQLFSGLSGWSTETLSSSWEEYKQIVTATSTTAKIRIFPVNNSGNVGDKVYVDNISIIKVS